MKTIFKFMCLSVLIALGISCSSSDNPESVAQAFAEHLYSGDIEGCKEYCTTETQQTIALMSSILAEHMDKFKESKPEVKALSHKISEDGKTATVELEVSNFYDPEKDQKVTTPEKETVDLKKVDDKWKVAMKK